jgi:hypothetical protein
MIKLPRNGTLGQKKRVRRNVWQLGQLFRVCHLDGNQHAGPHSTNHGRQSTAEYLTKLTLPKRTFKHHIMPR